MNAVVDEKQSLLAESAGTPSDAEILTRAQSSRVYDVARESPLEFAPLLSSKLGSDIWLKREDQQSVFSFKLRGAYNRMVKLDAAQRARGIIAASAGNHAQGVALAAAKLGIQTTIVMPTSTFGPTRSRR